MSTTYLFEAVITIPSQGIHFPQPVQVVATNESIAKQLIQAQYSGCKFSRTPRRISGPRN